MEYKFLSLMTNHEIRSMLADYGNSTGAEMNNFLARELIKMKNDGAYHPVLVCLDKYIHASSITEVNSEVKQFLGDKDIAVTQDNLIVIIRENKNRIYRDEAKASGLTSFVGNCENHRYTQFSIRGDHYFCSECYDEKKNKILYFPIRNLALKKFIDNYQLSINTVAQELGINSAQVYKYYNYTTSIPQKKWDAMSVLIKGIQENAAC